MPISTDMLAAFVKVAEHASVSRAAEELGVGKSVVSKRVAQLEAALKSTLFARSTRKVALTSAGEACLDSARRALAELATAEERLRDLRAQLSGQIRVTAPVSWGQRVLARVLPEFLRQHPAIEIDLLLADRMLDLARDRIDLALRWTGAPPLDLHAEPVARIEWLLAATPTYLIAAGTPAQPAHLADHPCMCYWRETADDAWVFTRQGQRRQVRVRGRYHADNPEAVAEATLAGLGIGLLPDYLCREAIDDGRLVRVLAEWTPQTKFGAGIVALVAPERLRLKRNQALLAHLQQMK